MGGLRQGVALQAGQPDRDRRRQPARPARSHRPRLGPGGLPPPGGGVRRPGVRDRRPRRRGDRPGHGRGGRPQRRAAVRHPGPHHQGPRRLRGGGPGGLARQAAPAGDGRTGHHRARRRASPARPGPGARRRAAATSRRPGHRGQAAGLRPRPEGGHPQGLRGGAGRARRPARRRGDGRRGQQLHLRQPVRPGASRPVLRDVHRRAAAGRRGGRRRRARLPAVRLDLRRVLHPGLRLHPDGRHLPGQHLPGRLARRGGDRRRRPVPDGAGGPGHDARGARLHRALPQRRHQRRRPGRGHGRPGRHLVHADHPGRLPGALRGRRVVPGRRLQGAPLRPTTTR